MKTKRAIAIVASVAFTLTAACFAGCTTANYGLAPSPVQDQRDTFKFKLFVGGFSGGETSDLAVKGDIEAYQKAHAYKGYKILDKRYNLVPSYFEYTVQFTRD